MHFKNTKDTYGVIAILLHWVIAAGFLAAYMAVYYRHWFAAEKFDPVAMNSNAVALYLHLSFGITLGVFILLRILWKLVNKTPDDVPGGSRAEHLAARGMHWALYAVMIIMPVTGYMGTRLDANYFFLFDLPKFNDTALYGLIVEDLFATDWETFEGVMDSIHKTGGAVIVWVLIVIHAGAALYHHLVRGDMVLTRMAPWIK